MRRRGSGEARHICTVDFLDGVHYVALFCCSSDCDTLIRECGTMTWVAAYNDQDCDVEARRAWREPGASAAAQAVTVNEDEDEDKDAWRAAFGRLLRAAVKGEPRGSLCLLVFEGAHLADLEEEFGSMYSFRALGGLTLIECHMPGKDNAMVLLPGFT